MIVTVGLQVGVTGEEVGLSGRSTNQYQRIVAVDSAMKWRRSKEGDERTIWKWMNWKTVKNFPAQSFWLL